MGAQRLVSLRIVNWHLFPPQGAPRRLQNLSQKMVLNSERDKQKADAILSLRVAFPLGALTLFEIIRRIGLKIMENGSGLSVSTMIGISLAVSSSFMNAMGLNLQRFAKGNNANKYVNVVGILLTASSGIVDLISFGFAPQSMLAPFGAMTLIFNLILSPIMHGEALSLTDVISTGLVCVGIATCLMFGNGDSPNFTYTQIINLAKRPVFVGFLVVYLTIMISLASHIIVGEQKNKASKKKYAVAYPCLSGMFVGVTVLNAKLMTELLKILNLKTHFHVIIPVICIVVTSAVTQATILNRGLGKASPLFVVPLFSATALVSNLGLGGMFFDEFSSFGKAQLLGFGLGVFTVVSGVSILATKIEKKKEN